MRKALVMGLVAALGLAAAQVTGEIGANTTGPEDATIFEVTFPSGGFSFTFDFTDTTITDPTRASWNAYRQIALRSGSSNWLYPTSSGPNTFTVETNVPFTIALGQPVITGTGFPAGRYRVTIRNASVGNAVVTLDTLTAPSTPVINYTGSAGTYTFSVSMEVFVQYGDDVSGYNQTITVPIIVIPNP